MPEEAGIVRGLVGGGARRGGSGHGVSLRSYAKCLVAGDWADYVFLFLRMSSSTTRSIFPSIRTRTS
jgi:hypothetical protein